MNFVLRKSAFLLVLSSPLILAFHCDDKLEPEVITSGSQRDLEETEKFLGDLPSEKTPAASSNASGKDLPEPYTPPEIEDIKAQ